MFKNALCCGVGNTAAAVMLDSFGYHGCGIAAFRLLGGAQRRICAINCDKGVADHLWGEGGTGRPRLKHFDHRDLVAIDINWRLLILNFGTGNPIPAVFRTGRAKVLLCTVDPKYGFGFP